MTSRKEQELTLVDIFMTTEAPQFHRAFADPSTLNRSTMQYEHSEVCDLRETLECHQQKAAKYVDFTKDLTKCTWDDVNRELLKAQEAADKSEKRGKNVVRKMWRTLGRESTIFTPGLAAVPETLCVLNGGLAVIFSVRSCLDQIYPARC